MSHSLRIQADLAFDSLWLKPNMNIPVNNINASTNLPEYLLINVLNHEDIIIISGVFSFRITSEILGISSSDYINIKIELFREEARINKAYYCEWQDSGVNIVANNYKIIQIPIQLVEQVSIPVTTDEAKYFISITATSNNSALAIVLLEEFCITAREVVAKVEELD